MTFCSQLLISAPPHKMDEEDWCSFSSFEGGGVEVYDLKWD